MPNIKKAYVDVVQFLEDNADKKVKTILDEVKELCSAKSGGGGGAASTFVKDGDEVVAVKCYYHGTWMDPRIVPFGAKANSATGLNNMCKAGVSKWTKQQRAFTKGKDDLLTRVTEGNLAADDIGKEMDKLEAARKEVFPLEGNYQGFETAEECIAFSAENPDFTYEPPVDETPESDEDQ